MVERNSKCQFSAFRQRKADILKDLSSSETDNSPKGFVDELALPIIDTINQHQEYATTSSCSGRTTVFLERALTSNRPPQSETDVIDTSRWLYTSHEPVKSIYDTLPPSHNRQEDARTSTSTICEILFGPETKVSFDQPPYPSSSDEAGHPLISVKFESFILHIDCATLESARKLLAIAASCGYRNSGISLSNAKQIVQIRCTLKLDTPIGFMDVAKNEIKCHISLEYLQWLIRVCNDKFEENTSRMDLLHRSLQKAFDEERDYVQIESKEERRERKRAAGLEKQRIVEELRREESLHKESEEDDS